MSLIMALANHNGIVVSADRLSVRKYYDENEKHLMDVPVHGITGYQKAFVLNDDHVIAFAGAGEIYGKVSTEDFICQLARRELDTLNLPIYKEAEYIRKRVVEAHDSDSLIALMVIGIEDGKNYILTTDTSDPEIHNNTDGVNGFKEIGITGLVGYLADKKKIDKYNLSIGEMSKFLHNLNVDAVDYMREHGHSQVISEDCDIIIITEQYNTRYDEHDLRRLEALR
nr:MAG TPA: Proteasome alpha subunit [Bacteriophage sp.]